MSVVNYPMSPQIHCKLCNSINIIKKGKRKLTNSARQKYYCKLCNHFFSESFSPKRTPLKIIIDTVILNNLIYILDYKPEANKQNIQKVTTHLYLYALALSFRTNFSLKHFTYAYFDQNNIFSFRPNQLKVNYD